MGCGEEAAVDGVRDPAFRAVTVEFFAELFMESIFLYMG
jgi:hypothetical protein